METEEGRPTQEKKNAENDCDWTGHEDKKLGKDWGGEEVFVWGGYRKQRRGLVGRGVGGGKRGSEAGTAAERRCCRGRGDGLSGLRWARRGDRRGREDNGRRGKEDNGGVGGAWER